MKKDYVYRPRCATYQYKAVFESFATIMNQAEFNTLIKKYQSGELDPKHKAIVDQWLETLGTNNEEVWTPAELETLHKRIMEDIDVRMPQRRNAPLIPIWRRWLPYAAAILLVGFGGVYYFQTIIPSAKNQTADKDGSTTESAQHILPGGNKATLTLADGRIVELSSDHAGIVVGDKLSYDDGTALLDEKPASGQDVGSKPDDLVLTTPKGGQYQLTLPDGSRVWLNAASTLKYPIKFTGSQREVELIGEAYFEIVKRTNQSGLVPFVVRTADQEVEVLGTQFNVAAYEDEAETRTTLVEGSVKVRQSANGVAGKGTALKLIPGEESVLTPLGIHARKANLTASIAWKSGIFAFEDIPFDQMMKQIARWYDIEVVYEGKVPKEQFIGKMGRDVNLQVLINFFRDSGINLRVKGHIIYVEE
ncbi:FecR domain-containing protein [Parapedobacter koreensis]|uniref:FecR family protein n=1 Tax=Parapedobacter koreensis TaxID=332977 RepID=A0A1H7UIT4_9SPHI|nr:FecR domain-containing protein [Parapedobacter koreensis]SEL96943.1 FecR family protein [Parapedobacter koreensis]